ncbi:polysaccharide deacetylase family protein [Aquimarina sp. BL5]|uniref:polysaccharide deacetylase family protein n=1 Tax=Aquimarina sp. BL5 TaxID=1714860 RepID=UPI000E51ACB5|nr:polysaccharide deacetylase family protein [Aquimarina sp. BL5]AXT53883.1 polysaccharide deacetylase family protein [Aquimarina sp. BL5]RKN04682.1 polysaccharide deacetylase family protein [Aquimarina sp. BL5]
MLIRKIVNIISIIAGILIVTAIGFNKLPWWSLLVLGLLWFFITAYGVTNIRSGYFLKSLSSNPKLTEKKIAITFDDGPDFNTLKILEVLNKYNVKGTFFCIGKQIEKHPDILKKIIQENHIIGNHTFTHDKLIDIYSTNKFTNEIKETDTIIEKFSKKKPLLFRPPYGITNPNIARAVKKTGHTVIGWNKRSFDTTIPSEKVILKRITKNLKGGDVILLHDTKIITVAVLEQLLLFLQRNNFTTVTIDELFSIQAYA